MGYYRTIAAKDAELLEARKELEASRRELAASKEELVASKNELEEENEKYAELMYESVDIGCKAMLKVRADLFREYREGKAVDWDVDRAIKEYEDAQSEEESDNETSAPSPSSPAIPSSPIPPS